MNTALIVRSKIIKTGKKYMQHFFIKKFNMSDHALSTFNTSALHKCKQVNCSRQEISLFPLEPTGLNHREGHGLDTYYVIEQMPLTCDKFVLPRVYNFQIVCCLEIWVSSNLCIPPFFLKMSINTGAYISHVTPIIPWLLRRLQFLSYTKWIG